MNERNYEGQTNALATEGRMVGELAKEVSPHERIDQAVGRLEDILHSIDGLRQRVSPTPEKTQGGGECSLTGNPSLKEVLDTTPDRVFRFIDAAEVKLRQLEDALFT